MYYTKVKSVADYVRDANTDIEKAIETSKMIVLPAYYRFDHYCNYRHIFVRLWGVLMAYFGTAGAVTLSRALCT